MRPARFALLLCLASACGGESSASSDAGPVPVDAAAQSPDAAAPDAGCSGDDACGEGACQEDGSCACPEPEERTAPPTWTRAQGSPLLVPGQEHADGTNYLIADPTAFYDENASEWNIWYAAARGECFACEGRAVVERATSANLLDWTVQENVALDLAEGGWDGIRTETPDVIYVPDASPERRYVMAYSGAGAFHPLGFPDYKIGIAFSADGRTFTRAPQEETNYDEDGLSLDELGVFPSGLEVTGGVVADPTIAYVDGTYHLWFSSFGCADGDTCADIRAFGVSHATSQDALRWTPDLGNPILEGAEQPSVFWNPRDCQFEMWFTRDAPGEEDAIPATFNPSAGTFRATSTDGSSWTVAQERDFPWDPLAPGEDLGLLTGVDVALHGQERVLFYVGMGTLEVPEGAAIPVQTSFNKAGFVSGTFGLGVALPE